MAKRKRRSRRKLPWPCLGKPIERLGPYDWANDLARQGQYERMLKLKKHYGIEAEIGWKPWYELALAIASEFDEGLKIVYREEPGTPRWKGADGYALLKLVEVLREHYPDHSERWYLKKLIEKNSWYGQFSLETLSVRLAEVKRHRLPAKKLRTWDGRIITRR